MAIFLSARQPFVQAVIWGGALLVGACTLAALNRRYSFKDIPTEVKLLAIFLLWSLLSAANVLDVDNFWRYFRLILQFVLIVAFLPFVISRSGSVRPIYFAFVVVGAGLPVLSTASLATGFTPDSLQSLDRVAEANGLGFQSVLGLAGVLGLLPETRRWSVRAALVAAALLSLYGVVLSASRGAFVGFFVVLTLWPLFCFRNWFRSWPTTLLALLLLGLIGYYFYDFVLLQTNLGRRFLEMEAFQDRSTQFRWELFLTCFKLAYQSTGVGVGLGQYGAASGTGYFAHNEFAELLGTTGIPGLLLFYLTYLTSWRRLQRVTLREMSSLVVYQANFAKMLLILIVLSGLFFRPNFLLQDTMFLYAVIVGISLWACSPQRHATVNAELHPEFQQ